MDQYTNSTKIMTEIFAGDGDGMSFPFHKTFDMVDLGWFFFEYDIMRGHNALICTAPSNNTVLAR